MEKYNKGFKFKPTFSTAIDHFEVDHLDEATNMVHTTVYPVSGFVFNDCIEKKYYDAAFSIGEYVKL